MLSNDGAKVYSVDINSIYIFENGKLSTTDKETVTPEFCVKQSSVVITGVPVKDYRLPTEWINPNTTVVNVSSFKNVDEKELLQIPGVVYVPMVGKVTVAMLQRNLIRLFEQFHLPNSPKNIMSEEIEPKTSSSRTDNQQKEPWYGNPIQLYTALT